MTISTYTTGAGSEMTRQLGSRSVKKRVLAPVVKVLIVIMQISWYAQQWSQALDESQTCHEVQHKCLDLMGKLWIFFRADLPERKKTFPS